MNSSDRSTASLAFPLAAEDRLQLALDADAIAGTWFWDVAYDRLFGDERLAWRFDLDAARVKAGIPIAEFIQKMHPDDAQRVQSMISACLQNGGVYRAEYRVWHPGGAYRWIEASGHVNLDGQGRALSFPGVVLDIDLRKQGELRQAGLLELGDVLRDLNGVADIAANATRICAQTISCSRSAYGVVGEEGRTIEMVGDWFGHPEWVSFSGTYRFEDYGTYIDDLHRGEVVSIADVALDARTATQSAALEAMHVKALLNVPLMRHGRLAGIFVALESQVRHWTADEIAFVRGLADRTWAAMATAQAHAQLQALNRQLELEVRETAADRDRLWTVSRDMLLIANFNGGIIATNPAWLAVLGWSEAELTGRSFFDLVHPDDMDSTAAAAAGLGEGQSYPVFENRYRHKDGSYRYISWSAYQGQGVIIASGRDWTLVKKQADSLKQAEEQLRQSQKMEAVGQLTGGIAHDFNNLLTIISSSMQLLQLPDLPEDRRPRFMSAITNAIERGEKLTSQLLSFARRQALQPEVFDAARNIANIRDMIQTLVGSQVQLLLQADTTPCLVDVDPGQFDTAIVNMAANARDAMGGNGSLSISTHAVPGTPSLRAHAGVAGNFIAISITDTGSGIAAENMERIFEPFFTTKAVGQGTGLGLSQVFGFAKQSRGNIQVDSGVGTGSTFTLYLPRAERAELAAVAAAEGVWSLDQAEGRLLCVEDNPEVAAIAEALLEELGYEVCMFDNGEDALAALREDPDGFSALFSDVMMSPMDGITLAREVQRLYPAMPILLTSGYSSVLASTTDHGFTVLSKPYRVDQLSAALQKLLADRRSTVLPAFSSEQDDRAPEELEQARLADLQSLNVLDTEEELVFDEVTRLAATLFDTPMALISLVDADRQWFKARTGIDISETARELSFCAHAIATPGQVMVVSDASKDSRFADHPYVQDDPHIRFYAGAPLVTSWGHAIGTVCVVDKVAREPSQQQLDALRMLARQVVERMEARRRGRRHDDIAPPG